MTGSRPDSWGLDCFEPTFGLGVGNMVLNRRIVPKADNILSS
jgi:hypothetical protein